MRDLLAGNPAALSAWIDGPFGPRLRLCLLTLVVGAGSYGATIGLWRSGEQAIYAAVKFPLVVTLTCGGNALLNGLLAQVFETGLTFRQTTLAILASFAIAGLALLSFVPLALFLLRNTPPLESEAARTGHSLTLLAHVGAIGFAGWIGNRRLYRLLAYRSRSSANARIVLLGWLAGNLLLGSQISWILRPFIGNPSLPVAFLREHPLWGGFFEQVWRSLSQLIF